MRWLSEYYSVELLGSAMIVIIGLVVLVAAVMVGLAGVLANGSVNHALTDDFAVFGYHVTGSTGLLFPYGIAVGLVWLSLLLAGAPLAAAVSRAAKSRYRAARPLHSPPSTTRG
ncbi:hypothetical protein [Nocardia nova]|uniref:hypothetical protein n=1 Tax=Nocardia nova TaxID=37330 RepID=UPI003F6D3D43